MNLPQHPGFPNTHHHGLLRYAVSSLKPQTPAANQFQLHGRVYHGNSPTYCYQFSVLVIFPRGLQKQLKERKVYFSSRLRVQSVTQGEQQVAGHIASTAGKLRAMNSGARLPFPFSSCSETAHGMVPPTLRVCLLNPISSFTCTP